MIDRNQLLCNNLCIKNLNLLIHFFKNLVLRPFCCLIIYEIFFYLESYVFNETLVQFKLINMKPFQMKKKNNKIKAIFSGSKTNVTEQMLRVFWNIHVLLVQLLVQLLLWILTIYKYHIPIVLTFFWNKHGFSDRTIGRTDLW